MESSTSLLRKAGLENMTEVGGSMYWNLDNNSPIPVTDSRDTAQNKTKAVLSIGKLTPERWPREVPAALKGDPAMGGWEE